MSDMNTAGIDLHAEIRSLMETVYASRGSEITVGAHANNVTHRLYEIRPFLTMQGIYTAVKQCLVRANAEGYTVDQATVDLYDYVCGMIDQARAKATKETVNHPPHYNRHPSGVECIDIVRHFNFNIGNVIKYCWRAGLKGGRTRDRLADLRKAAWYIQDEIKRLERGNKA